MTQTHTAPTTTPTMPTPPPTWRGRAARTRQRLGVNLASMGLGVPLIYLVIASGKLLGSQSTWTITPPDESELHLVAWQYRIGGGQALRVIEWGYPPLLIGILLFAGLLLLSVNQGLAGPIRKAQGKLVSTYRSAPEERARMRAELRAAGYTCLLTSGAKVRLILAGVTAAAVAATAAFVPIQEGFTKGVGPTVCVVGALVALVGVVLTAPWTHWPTVGLLPDGRLMVDGVEPLAGVRDAAPLPTGAMTPAPVMSAGPAGVVPSGSPAAPPAAGAPAPGWYPDPGGGHERRYWDGGRWTSDVADTDPPRGVAAAADEPQALAG